MKHISKSQPEPVELRDYRARLAAAPRPPTWAEFKTDPRRREPVKNRLRQDQRGLCAYCENNLIPQNESVEHFIARDADHSLELDWSNLLLCCMGGEKALPENVDNGPVRFEADGSKTCGHAKLNSPAVILNPLHVPAAVCVFRFGTENGEIYADAARCKLGGVVAEQAERTITVLNLRAGHLNRARQELLGELLRQLGTDGVGAAFSVERAREIAAQQIPAAGHLPKFFTTIRWFLGEGAETHLQYVDFTG